MAGFVDASEGEVAVFSHLAVLLSAPDERRIALLGELLRVLVLQSKADCLSAEPVACVKSVYALCGKDDSSTNRCSLRPHSRD